MNYIFGSVVILLVVSILIYLSKRRSQKKLLESIRISWGNPRAGYTNFEMIETYSNNCHEEAFHKLNEQTIQDLDLRNLFTFVDRTSSRIGQQYLFKTLTEPTNKTDNPWSKLCQLFTNQHLREETQAQLNKLNSRDAYYVETLLAAIHIVPPKWYNLIYLNLCLIFCLLTLSFKFPICLIFLLIPLTASMVIHFWNKKNTMAYMLSIPQLNILMDVSEKIASLDSQLHNEKVKKALTALKSFKRKSLLVSFNPDSSVEDQLVQIMTGVIQLVKNMLMIEVIALFSLLKELQQKEKHILTLFNYIGKIDTSISICSLTVSNDNICYPEFKESSKQLSATNIYHPMIEQCVENSIHMDGKSVLITGSNMSGKSTFLRTLGINSVLAQTLYLCFADEFISPILKVQSSIRIDDNLFEGKSYYLEEVNVIGQLLESAQTKDQYFYILDEVFKGTNTQERIAAAKAVLSFLNQKNHLVMVATHDLELIDMLQNSFDLYHFSEDIVNNQLQFDHLIKEGPLQTRNAIRLLELCGYPTEVISEAKILSRQ